MNHNEASTPLLLIETLPTTGQTPGAQLLKEDAAQTGNCLVGNDGVPRAVVFAGADPANSGAITSDYIQPFTVGTAIITDATASVGRIRLKTLNGKGTATQQRVSLGFAQAVGGIAVNGGNGTLLGAAPGTAAPCTIDVLSDTDGELDVSVTFSTAGTKVFSIATLFAQLTASVAIT